MTIFLICVLTLLLLRQTTIEGVSNEYAARCIFDDKTSISCQVALFSAFTFDINGTISYSSSKYCQKSLETARNTSDILIVNRGDCSFEDKVKNAERDGYIALIIVNTDNTTFPAGASEGYSSKIPVLTIGNTFLDELDEKNECKLKYLQLSYTARPKPSSQGDEGGGSSSAPSLSSMICLLLSILVLAATVNVSTTHYRYLVGMLLFVLLLSLRMGTFRSISHVNGASEYNHNETDERIFATLIQSVSKDMWDYKLHASTIEQFRLSKENYSTDIFIHPPFFVYSSAILQYYTGISLPSVIICHHIITALCIPLLITGMASDSIPHVVVENLSVLSLVLFLLCPISAFCSQKIWIDNCLMMTVTVSATAHVHLTNYTTKSLRSAYFSSLVSGLVLGGLALNTKITAIAIGPFLGSYTAYKVLQRVWKDKLPVSTASWDILTHGVCILVGMCVSHGPWVYTYHRVTGRLLPSAWPSKSMLEASAFVRSAVNKPGHTYLLTLLTISPIALVGLVHTMQNIATYLYHSFGVPKVSSRRRKAAVDEAPVEIPSMSVLVTWPLSFLVGLTAVGIAGGGFQTRFLLPILPATSVLSGYCILRAVESKNLLPLTIHLFLLAYGAFHTLYYGILYPPLYADLDYSVHDVLQGILASEYVPPANWDSLMLTRNYMKHFGLVSE